MAGHWSRKPALPKDGDGGSIPPPSSTFAGVAKTAQPLICNQMIVGSIPTPGSTLTDSKHNGEPKA